VATARRKGEETEGGRMSSAAVHRNKYYVIESDVEMHFSQGAAYSTEKAGVKDLRSNRSYLFKPKNTMTIVSKRRVLCACAPCIEDRPEECEGMPECWKTAGVNSNEKIPMVPEYMKTIEVLTTARKNMRARKILFDPFNMAQAQWKFKDEERARVEGLAAEQKETKRRAAVVIEEERKAAVRAARTAASAFKRVEDRRRGVAKAALRKKVVEGGACVLCESDQYDLQQFKPCKRNCGRWVHKRGAQGCSDGHTGRGKWTCSDCLNCFVCGKDFNLKGPKNLAQRTFLQCFECDLYVHASKEPSSGFTCYSKLVQGQCSVCKTKID
jgi:hypothetical protein